MAKRERINWIDALRGFAIICVVLGHVVKGYLDTGLFAEHVTALRYLYNGIYVFHMPLFFFLSGMVFLLTYAGGKQRRELDRRRLFRHILNLALLYVIYSLLFGILKMIFADQVNVRVGLTDLLMIWARPIQLFWFLYVLILLLLIFSVDRIRTLPSPVLLLCSFALSILTGFLAFPSIFCIRQLCYHAVFFVFGMVAARLLAGKREIPKGLLGICGILAAVLIAVFFRPERYLNTIPVVNTLTAISVTLLLVALFRSIPRLAGNCFLTFCGRHSLSIFLLHSFFVTAFRSLVVRNGDLHVVLAVVLNLILGISFSLLAERILKKTPLHRFFFAPADFFLPVSGK